MTIGGTYRRNIKMLPTCRTVLRLDFLVRHVLYQVLGRKFHLDELPDAMSKAKVGGRICLSTPNGLVSVCRMHGGTY